MAVFQPDVLYVSHPNFFDDLFLEALPWAPSVIFGWNAALTEPHVSWSKFDSILSTHDMSTLRGWWEEDAQQTQRYYNHALGHYGTAPAVATPELCEQVVRAHLTSNSMLSILSFQDWMSIDGQLRNPNVAEERINVPANPRHYWRYRMHLTLEQLMAADDLNNKIRQMIADSGR